MKKFFLILAVVSTIFHSWLLFKLYREINLMSSTDIEFVQALFTAVITLTAFIIISMYITVNAASELYIEYKKSKDLREHVERVKYGDKTIKEILKDK